MTIRTVGAVLLKLLGVYYAASAALSACSSVGYLLMPPSPGAVRPVQIVLGASIGGWIGGGLVASFLILRGDDVAGRLFPDTPLSWPHVTPRALLAVGFVLIGITVAVSGAVNLARAGATALWYAGAERQGRLVEAMRRLYPSPVDAAMAVVVGGLLAWQSTRLSDLFSRRHSDVSER